MSGDKKSCLKVANIKEIKTLTWRCKRHRSKVFDWKPWSLIFQFKVLIWSKEGQKLLVPIQKSSEILGHHGRRKNVSAKALTQAHCITAAVNGKF